MARFHAHAEPKKASQRASNVHLIKSDGQMEKASNPVSAGIFHLGSRFLKTCSPALEGGYLQTSRMSWPLSRFLSLACPGTWRLGCSLWCGGRPVLGRLFSSVPGLHPRDATNVCCPSCDNQNVPRHCQSPLRGHSGHPLLKTTASGRVPFA